MLKRYRIRDYDFKLVLMLIAISVIGILVIGSAEKSVQDKQIMGLIIGVFLMIMISLFDYTALLNLYWGFYLFKGGRRTALVLNFWNPFSAFRTCKNFVDFVLRTVYYETKGENKYTPYPLWYGGIAAPASVFDL